MARAVTLTEFQEWLKKPEVLKYTWLYAFGDKGEMAKDFEKCMEGKHYEDALCIAKYFITHIDTREMLIYSIKTDEDHLQAFESLDTKGTILDELLEQFKKEAKSRWPNMSL